MRNPLLKQGTKIIEKFFIKQFNISLMNVLQVQLQQALQYCKTFWARSQNCESDC